MTVYENLLTPQSAWQPNTDLIPFDLEATKKEVETGNPGKKNKQLWEAFQIAAEGHDLNYFKDVLASHEQAIQEDDLIKEAKREEKAEKAAKKAASKRKSTAAVDDEDVEMGDADDTTAASAKKAKPSKKRKKEDSEGDDEKVRFSPDNVGPRLIQLTACKDAKDYAETYHQEDAC